MNQLYDLFEPVIVSMGYELVGIEFGGGIEHGTLRVYIDSESGIMLEDCSAVSHQLSAVLDVEEPIAQAYDLEVSSPGIDRPLFKLEDYHRFCGSQAKIKMNVGLLGRRNFKGQIISVLDSNEIEIEVDGVKYELPFADIAKANLVS
ncbi:MAG: ribosome maturation factor RimP [Gammaproteobacteria bacterium]|jgi:ribosome maturation factor RimP